MHGLEAQYSDRIQFTYLDVDDSATSDLKQALRYRAQPHLFLLDAQGQKLNEWLGFISQADLEAALNKALE